MFDPYRKWLGIPPKDQPPNHYRMLGIELFETDLDVIEGAADKQMSFVRQYQSGEYAAAAARILNELALARLCLLKPATKAAYDEKLRQQLVPPVAEPDPKFPQGSLSFSDDAPKFKPGKAKAKPSKSAASSQLLIMGGGFGAACLLLVAFIFSRGGQPPKPKDSTKGATGTATPTKSDVEPKPEAIPTRPPSTNEPPSDPILWREAKLVIEPVGEPMDLLKLIDLDRDVVSGEWKQTEDKAALIGPANGKLYLPAKLSENYQLKFAVRRLEGNETIIFGFLMSGRQGMVMLDGWGSTVSGIFVDGRHVPDNCTTRRGALFADQSLAQIVITVHPGHLQATFNGQTIINWHGDPERLQVDSSYGMGSRELPFIMLWTSKYAFESANLIPLKPERAISRTARLDRDVDVLPLVDVDRDMQRGIWSLNKNTLHSPEGFASIYLPTIVPDEYTLSGTIELPADSRGSPVFTFGLPAGDFLCQIHIKNDDCVAIDTIDGRRYDQHDTRLSGAYLKPGVPSKFDCTVTKSGIRMEIDERTLIDWRGEFQRLSVPGEWILADARRLYLGSLTHFKLRDIKLTAPIPPPKQPDHAPITTQRPIDLLSLIDPARDARVGTWTKDGSVLRTLADAELTKLIVPVDVPHEYLLRMLVAREPGGRLENEAINLVLPVGSSKADLVIDGTGSQFTGIRIGNRDWNGNETLYRGMVIPPGPAVEIVVEVKSTGIKVTSLNKTIIDWTGNPDNFTCQNERATGDQWIGIAAWQTRFRIEKLEIQALHSTNFPPAKPLEAGGKLLPIINVARDSRIGEWKQDSESLRCPSFAASRLNLPVSVPPRFVFSTKVERIAGDRQLWIGLVVGGHPCAVSLDEEHGQRAGIDLLDDRRSFDPSNFTFRRYNPPLLPKNQSVLVRCVVLPDTIVVTCGDKEVIRWHGDARRLTALRDIIPPHYSEADRIRFWLGSWESSFVFRDLELHPLNDPEANELSKSFSGVYPTTSQADVPLKSTAGTMTVVEPKVMTTTAKVPANLLPVPVRDDVEAARTRILKNFANEYKDAKTDELKRQLAGRLLERAFNHRESPEDRYAFFVEARDIHLQLGNVAAAFQVVDAMATTFRLARFEEQADLVQSLAKKAKNAAQNRHVAVAYWKLAGDAAAEEDYATAKDVCQRAVAASRSSGDSELQARATSQLRYYENLLADWKAAKDAEQTLMQQRNDASANAAVGAYRCWVRRDWAKGLPSLRQSTDSKLVQIVTADVASPTAAGEQRALADLWIAYAKEQKNPVIRESAASRAADWYEKAIPALSDADKPDAKQEMESACELACGHDFTRWLSQPANGIDIAVTIDCQSKVYPLKLKSTIDIKKSWMLSLEFNPPNLDSGLHQIFCWGDSAKGENPLRMTLTESRLSVIIENVEHRGQTMVFQLPANAVGQWTELKLVYDGIDENLELYVNHRLVRRQFVGVPPLVDRDVPLILGGDGTDGSRFTGQVRKLWLGNIP